MSIIARPPSRNPVEYPESDGQPMSDNTKQFRWMTTIQGGLDTVFGDNDNVFVAGNLLWYPVEGNNTIRVAPDVMVVFGRPKGDRGSYLQWLEGNIAPQVTFEIVAPGNRPGDLINKFRFYDRYGVEEYYLWDPDFSDLNGWVRDGGALSAIPEMNGWVSPRLEMRFELADGDLRLYGPDGEKFATYVELAKQGKKDMRRADRLAAQLKALGVEPEL